MPTDAAGRVREWLERHRKVSHRTDMSYHDTAAIAADVTALVEAAQSIFVGLDGGYLTWFDGRRISGSSGVVVTLRDALAPFLGNRGA